VFNFPLNKLVIKFLANSLIAPSQTSATKNVLQRASAKALKALIAIKFNNKKKIKKLINYNSYLKKLHVFESKAPLKVSTVLLQTAQEIDS
jgi:hypothetical protein